MAGIIVAVLVVVFLVIMFARTVRVVAQAKAGIVEREAGGDPTLGGRGQGDRDCVRRDPRAHPDPKLLSYQYLQMLPELAKGDANKVFVIPSEFAEAFGGLSKAFNAAGGGDKPAGELPGGENSGGAHR